MPYFITQGNKGNKNMAIDISYVNNYGYAIDNSSVQDTVKLVLNNAAQKSANTPEEVIAQKVNSTNSALLFEYNQNIAKSNIAQQLVLDANLKETLKFLNSEAAKKMSKTKKKEDDVVKKVVTNNDIMDFESEEQAKEDDDIDNLELFGIKIDMGKNIFAA